MKETLLDDLNSMSFRLGKIKDVIQEVSIDLQVGNEGRAMLLLQGICNSIDDSIDDMVYLIGQTRDLFGLDYSHIAHGDRNVDKMIQDLKENLLQIIAALEQKDLVLLSDLLEYRLNPLLSSFQDITKVIVSKVSNN
ncbi:MAG: hypothetical protein QME40_01305 [bacterium]|nr:hypothetical protein [bacterium]